MNIIIIYLAMRTLKDRPYFDRIHDYLEYWLRKKEKWSRVFYNKPRELNDVLTNNGLERLNRTVKSDLGISGSHQSPSLVIVKRIHKDLLPNREKSRPWNFIKKAMRKLQTPQSRNLTLLTLKLYPVTVLTPSTTELGVNI